MPASNQKKTDLFDLVGFYRPADGRGGDWWSHFSPDAETLFVFVGDVTGHGPGSAMMTASVASYLKAMEHLPGVPNVPDLLLRLNEYLIELQSGTAQKDRYLMTMVGFETKLAQKQMTIYSAGHPFPFIMHADGSVDVVGGTGMPLGHSHEMTLGRESVYLNPGDRLFAYTDGLTEMKIGPERMYGEKRLSKLLATTREMAALASPVHIVAKLDEARKEFVQDDDFTFIVLDIN